MRRVVDKRRLREFLTRLGRSVRTRGRAYLVGGTTAIDLEWRGTTKDIDLWFDPEPAGLYEAIFQLKEHLDINVEVESPAHFVPPLPGHEARARSVGRFGELDVFHFDLYTQALAKIERGHSQDLTDVAAMFRDGLVDPHRLLDLFTGLERAQLLRYPRIDPDGLEERVRKTVDAATAQEAPLDD